ncbi:Zn(II)2Cys6 transcription factor [Aspergillus mulundensis]|uniref:Putative Zn(II)2Cys6 transcription factor n=1 Tax=Aspergillus mulundensis TaxID=1810919 RepID=A0A3D8SYC4_9EURO|nr:putative Zn(II)2Cys6 transcription factor [Aspergillus mulundensis]RDW90768.1 putative Zn(II)2Cys6 transcription factor [Aspergillus mulundensis]
MAHSFNPPQTSMAGYIQEPPPLSAYSILGQNQYPESVALWSAQQPQQPQPQQPQSQSPAVPLTPATPRTPSLLQPLPDQKKHKRTRSGCFTCRSRRIKCDETRPVCDRCRKGNRECVYPSTTGPASKPAPRSVAKAKASRPQSRGSDSSGPVSVDTDETRTFDLAPIADEEEEGSPGSSTHQSPTATGATAPTGLKSTLSKKKSAQSLHRRKVKQQVVPAADPNRKEDSSSPSTETSSRYGSLSARSDSVGFHLFETVGDPNTAHLPEDLRFYLSYHQDSLNYRHYFMRSRSNNFVKQTIVEYALQYEPLLYAIVGFSAYHHVVQTGGGNLYSFLKYYNKALSLLRRSLGSGEPYSEATLATVLVLVNFEEFVGDWVNLIDHHQAAHFLIRQLISPESASSDKAHRHLFEWYARFDITAGIVSGNELVLGREWYVKTEEYDIKEAAENPDDIEKHMTMVSSIGRRFGLELASLYAKLSRGMIEYGDFLIENEQLGQSLERMKDTLSQYAGQYVVETFPNQQPLTGDDLVDPYVPGSFHYGPLWDVNFYWIDYYACRAMFKFQFIVSTQQGSMNELLALSYEMIRLMETIERWPDKENGYIFAFKNSITLASLFLPQDDRHFNWARRGFATLEQNGYVITAKYRAALAAIWQLPEINDWWLPDGKDYPSIIRQVREMTAERTTNPRDDYRESVRDMKAVFGKLNLDDTESETSPASTTDVPHPTTSN